MSFYSAFCQDVSGRGTIWIGSISADDIEDAILEARTMCAQDWGFEIQEVHCLGLAVGDVQIVHWEDIED